MKQWWKNFIHKKVMAELDRQLKDEHSPVFQRVRAAGLGFGQGMMIRFLDEKGLRHCRFCPSQDQLQRHGSVFMCPTHLKIYLEREAVEKMENFRDK